MRIRSRSGSSIAELPVAIIVLLFVLLFPLADLCTIGLRSATVFAAARNAAHHAGRAKSFLADSEEGELSAKNTAIKWAVETRNSCIAGTAIAPDDVKLEIVGTPLDGKQSPMRSSAPLKETQQDTYVYQIEVQVTGSVEPLITMNKKLFGPIPGLTEPVIVTAACREFCEHPDGLGI